MSILVAQRDALSIETHTRTAGQACLVPTRIEFCFCSNHARPQSFGPTLQREENGKGKKKSRQEKDGWSLEISPATVHAGGLLGVLSPCTAAYRLHGQTSYLGIRSSPSSMSQSQSQWQSRRLADPIREGKGRLLVLIKIHCATCGVSFNHSACLS